jgi:hypothetical protein
MNGPRAATRRAGALGVALAALLCAGCGAEVPRGGAGALPRVPDGPRMARRVEAVDIIPGDLDLVVRFDVARMRSGLGPDVVRELSRRAVPARGEELLARALERAEVVWLGMRAADLDSGDRVLVVEGNVGGLGPSDGPEWTPEKTALRGVTAWDRTGPVDRHGTARVVVIEDRALAFVSAVQAASVARVLREGPDDNRAAPPEDGVVSLELRPRPLPAPLAERYPAIARVIAGVERVRATASLVDGGARIEAELGARSAEDAQRAQRFLMALRDNVQTPRYVELMRTAQLEQLSKAVRLRWDVPASAILAWLGDDPSPPSAPASPPPSAPASPPAAPSRRFE